MKEIIKSNLKYVIFLFLCGLVGGYFVGVYLVQMLPADYFQEGLNQVSSLEMIYLISGIQYAIYSVVFGLIGKYYSKKIGIWRKIEFSSELIIKLIIASVVAGVLLLCVDVFVFANYSESIKASYYIKPTIENFLASIIGGGGVEEIMLRLFWMTLVAVLLQKILKIEVMCDKILILANIVSALMFALGHLPATEFMLELTPVTLVRGFLLNGLLGLLFGRFYRKYGIHSAMVVHAGTHIVCKLVWLFFI